MATSRTAPMNIPPSHPTNPSLSSSTSSLMLSSPPSLTFGESLADSGYESSWPSLSEAAAWTPLSLQKRPISLSKPLSSTAYNSLNSININRTAASPGGIEYVPSNSFGKNGGNGWNHQPIQKRQGQDQVQKAARQSKNRRRNQRTQAYQAKGLMQLQQHMVMPLVDFGSPQMEDDDHYFGAIDPPIPLSVIPRGWLYEEEHAPPPADDILITLPKREWIYDSSGPMSMDAKSFVLMSWNVLSPKLCHASRLDANCEPVFLDWDYRKEAILNQIAFADADIELELKDHDEYFKPRLSRLGFRSIHAYKMNMHEMRDGCAIFYRDSRFRLLTENVLRFNQVELDEDDVKRPSMARDTAIRFNLFHNLAIVALFENKRTKRQVQVATTHLLADPAFPDAKMLQTAILTSKLEELKAQAMVQLSPPVTEGELLSSCEVASEAAPVPTPASSHNIHRCPHHQHRHQHPQQHIPTILAGDFNSLPDSSVVEFLKTGKVETRHFGGNDFGRFTRADNKYFYHHLELADSYKLSTLPFTNATRKFQGTIDYLLYDPTSLGLIGFLDHLATDPSLDLQSGQPALVASLPSSTTYKTSSATAADVSVNMSSSDLDSEIEVEIPSSAASSASASSTAPINTSAGARASNNRRHSIEKKILLDFSKLFISNNLESSKATASASTPDTNASKVVRNEEAGTNVRAALPTALPNQHFPSDHIPLVAIFREREYIPLCTQT
ncbi:Glucose-repressible alcohol dehydrogenase transcriptional effector [Lobosporangium transversale]|nr:Glucose-repressible alcohol dehydrogenase transcriptional effector [Lobosporangium transversale]